MVSEQEKKALEEWSVILQQGITIKKDAYEARKKREDFEKDIEVMIKDLGYHIEQSRSSGLLYYCLYKKTKQALIFTTKEKMGTLYINDETKDFLWQMSCHHDFLAECKKIAAVLFMKYRINIEIELY